MGGGVERSAERAGATWDAKLESFRPWMHPPTKYQRRRSIRDASFQTTSTMWSTEIEEISAAGGGSLFSGAPVKNKVSDPQWMRKWGESVSSLYYFLLFEDNFFFVRSRLPTPIQICSSVNNARKAAKVLRERISSNSPSPPIRDWDGSEPK